jgi:hypothetical protein
MIWMTRNALAILTRRDFALYISCGPFFYLFPFVFLAWIVGRGILLDFRDPWSVNIRNRYGETPAEGRGRNLWKARLSELVEIFAYRRCVKFIVCTPGMRDAYAALFGDDCRVVVMPNGFDFDDSLYNSRESTYEPIPGKRRFVCLGKFAEYGKGADAKARRVLDRIRCIRDEQGCTIHIEFVGSDPLINGRLIEECGLSDSVTFRSRIAYEDALRIAALSDEGIMIVRNEDLDFGTKVFDYIGLGLPILDTFDRTKGFYKHFRDVMQAGGVVAANIRRRFSRDAAYAEHVRVFEIA